MVTDNSKTISRTSVIIKNPIGNEEQPASFEDIVTFLGFGKFNWIFILATSVAMCCSIFETTSISYIFTSAKCDLDLSTQDKGNLNSIIYAGMITSALVWGYLGDTFGRKNLLIVGFFSNAFCILGSSLSQNLTTLLVFKFFGGVTINGVLSNLSTYLSEFHSAKYRPKIQLYFGFMFSFALTLMPLIAWLILFQNWNFVLFSGSIEIHPWNIFLFVCAMPALSSAIILLFLPESPKFLMTTGNNDKALKIFQRMYHRNTGNPPENFPFKKLVDETKVSGRSSANNRTKMQALREGFQQIVLLFHRPYLSYITLVCLIHSCFLLGYNTLRLWTPQIFQAIADYEQANNGSTTYLCTMIENLTQTKQEDDVCIPSTEHFSVYYNSMILSGGNMLLYSLTGTIITLMGKKKMLVFLGSIGGASLISLYFAADTITATALLTTYIALVNVCSFVMLNIIVDLFPTTIRMFALSITLMIARAGVTIGNFVFPMLLQLGCAPPIFILGCLNLGSTILCLFLPNTDNKPLK